MLARLRDIGWLKGRSAGRGAGEEPEGLVAVDALLDDPALSSLAQELRGLGAVEAPAAARERTWALLRQELEQRPAAAVRSRADAPSGRHSADQTHGVRRWALGSVALVAASALGLAVAFGGFLDDDQTAGTGTQTTQVAEGPGTTVPTPGTGVTVGPGGTVTSVPGSTSTDVPGALTTTPVTTQPTSGPTVPPATGGPSSTDPPTTQPPTTAEPAPTTTAGEKVMTREQREGSAGAAALFVAEKVVNGDLGGARSVLAGSASSGLVQMASSLENPNGYRIVDVNTDIVGGRVLIQFDDQVDDGQGGVIETVRRFYMDIRFEAKGGAVVTAIYKAPPS